MVSKKGKIVLAILLFLISLVGLPKITAAKSLYVIAEKGELLFSIRAYDIQENALIFQKGCFLPYAGSRPLGLAMDFDSEILFIIYEFSNIIQLIDARKMRCLGSITAPGAQYLAAIALDHDASLLYAVEQSSDNLYVYDWDAADRTIEFREKHDLPGLIDDLYGGACGMDLDEQNHLLYVSNRTKTVNFYRLHDPEQRAGSLTVSNLATAIAVDAGRGFVYSGGLRASNYHLSRYDLHTKTEKTKPLASHYELKDLAVDEATGFVYCTMGLSSIGGNLTSYDTSLNPIFMTGGRGLTPGPLCIPTKEVKFNPLNLKKSDGIEKGGSVSPGSNITYTISYDNQGQSHRATGVSIADTLPKGAAFISGFGDYTLDGQAVTWYIGNLGPNAERNSVGIVVQVDSDIKPGSLLHNTCSIKSDQWPSIYAAVDTLIDIKKYTLTISADPGGLTDPPLGSHAYEQGKDITITAVPDPGYVFSNWTGDVAAGQEKENPLTLGMDSDKNIKANFCQTKCRLTIAAGLGGTTDPKPGTYAYDPGKRLKIGAIPKNGYIFDKWSGSITSRSNPLTLTMDSERSIKANFAASLPGITVTTSPSRKEITVDGTNYKAPQTFLWKPGSSHVVAASSPQDDDGSTRSVYDHWSDGGDQKHTIMSPATPDTYTAYFNTEYSLSTSPNSADGGTINPSGTTWYMPGKVASVEAKPNPGYVFKRWNGDASGTDNPISLTMDSPKKITADFGLMQYGLTIVAGLGGTTDPKPGTYAYDPGKQATISAIPDKNCMFEKWSGDASGTDNPLTLTMDSDKSITANFAASLLGITVTTSPPGKEITVDRTNYKAPQTFQWIPGSSHTLEVSSPQYEGIGTRFVYDNWSDRGAQKHTIIAPSTPDTYTAYFSTEYSLTTSPNPVDGGTVNPSGTTWYLQKERMIALAIVEATSSSGYTFTGWSGDASGMNNPLYVTMNSPKTITANFDRQYILTIKTGLGGTTNPSPGTYTFSPGKQATINAIPDRGYSFAGWSGDVSGMNNPLIVTMDSDKSIVADFIPQKF